MMGFLFWIKEKSREKLLESAWMVIRVNKKYLVKHISYIFLLVSQSDDCVVETTERQVIF